jgi:hypothetical protein
LAFLAAITAPACGGDKGVDELDARVEKACEDACKRATSLDCVNEKKLTDVECRARCMSLFRAEPNCEEKYRNLTECVAKAPKSDWACNDQGEADVVEGVCDNEYNALDHCM